VSSRGPFEVELSDACQQWTCSWSKTGSFVVEATKELCGKWLAAEISDVPALAWPESRVFGLAYTGFGFEKS